MTTNQPDNDNPLQRLVSSRRRAVAAITAGTVFVLAVWLVSSSPALPDFTELEAGKERKAAFFEFMRPLVGEANADIVADRERLAALAASDEPPGWAERRWLHALAEDYDLDAAALEDDELVATLLRRVDTVPASLALAQAAMESGWGTSRFARQGNNLFGQWCFESGCGIVPASRPEGLTHEVKDFDSPLDSVRAYLHNINTNAAYKALRQQRAALRRAGQRPSGVELAIGLSRYSERGAAYVREIQQLIRRNELDRKVSVDEPR